MTPESRVTFEDILALLPHRPPFLFVDRVIKIIADTSIIAERDLRADEPHFAGHFPSRAIMPGVLITDALAQTSGLLWGLSKRMSGVAPAEPPQIFFLAADAMKFVNPALPGETLRLSARAERQFGTLFSYAVEATVRHKLIARGTLTLAMMEQTL
jgi:3-hydroxyacyl-[acyl-carrier-protein] dehydratase